MTVFLLLSVLSDLLLQCAAQSGDTPSTYWTSPGAGGQNSFYIEDVVYQINTTQQLRWVTNETFYSIYLFQQQALAYATVGQSIYTKEETDQEQGGYLWTVNTQSFSLSNSSVFFFSLAPTVSLYDQAFTCHYFNITDNPLPVTTTFPSSTTTTASSIATSSVTTTSSTPASTSASASSTTSLAPSPSSASSTSPEAIGLGVGLGIGIPIVLLLAALVFFLIYRSRKQDRSRTQSGYGIAQQNDHMAPQNSDAGPPSKPFSGGSQGEKHSAFPVEEHPTELGPGDRRSYGLAELGAMASTR
ncbi:hypothetical protein MMC11_001967 [Xylographa trunciseda]|nr:hypothetical protein [Xylographa trunciseda]